MQGSQSWDRPREDGLMITSSLDDDYQDLVFTGFFRLLDVPEEFAALQECGHLVGRLAAAYEAVMA